MSDQLIVEREGLEKKDKGELQAIVSALGGTSSARMRKSDLIDKILDLSGASAAAAESDGQSEDAKDAADSGEDGATDNVDVVDAKKVGADDKNSADKQENDEASVEADEEHSSDSDAANENDGNSVEDHPVGPDGEPLADWEIKVLEEGGQLPQTPQRKGRGRNQRGDKNKQSSGQGQKQGRDQDRNQGQSRDQDRNQDRNQGKNRDQDRNQDLDKNQDKNQERGQNQAQGQDKNGDGGDDTDPNNRRSRRRGRGRGRDRDEAGNDPISNDPIEVSGFLDLRDEGYAFLRVNGALPSRDDAYVSVKQVRQHSLRKGDHVTGLSRPANRNEKNPALAQLNTVNGKAPEEAKGRPRFDKLTPVFPDERLVLENKGEPLDMTSRIIDLVAPIGKGQRGLIVSPPLAGKTSIIKSIASAIEANNPEVVLIVLLIDERPEEVTDMERHLSNGEVVSSTFDRPAEEHTAVAELTLERAKRMVEEGKDVCIILDSITRLARAYNMSAPQSGRVLSGGVDAAALYPPKRFLGAARNIEEGGSLTMLATALIETGSPMDEVIFEEFKGTGNMELRLDGRLADKRIFPAIDIGASSTRNEELLRPVDEVEASWKLRKVVSDLDEDGGGGAAGVEMLLERLPSFKKNDGFLSEISTARP